MRQSLLNLPRTVWLIGLISLVNDSASEMLYPLIPLYLSSVLMAGPRALGLIEGVAEATSSLLKLFSGVVMDRTQRAKPWIIAGYVPATLGRPLVAFVSNWPWLLAIRFADRLGKGLRTSPRDALLASSVAPERRGLAFGLYRAMDNAGAVIGPLVAAWLLHEGVALKQVFLWSIVPGLLCVALAWMLHEPELERPPSPPSINWRWADLPPVMRRYLIVVALFTLGNASNMFLLLRARELGVAPAQIPILWATVSVVAMLFSAPLSALSDKLGRVRLLIGGYLSYGLSYIGMGQLLGTGWRLYLLFALYGLFMAATEGVEKAMVADLAPASQRGTAYGWFNLVAGLFLLPSSVAFGWVYQQASPALAFALAGGCAIGAAALLMLWVWPLMAQAPKAPGLT
jgi:MFS family permease